MIEKKSIPVYHDGSCQCFGDCDCYLEKGKLLWWEEEYTHPLLVKKDGKLRKYKTLEAITRALKDKNLLDLPGGAEF